MNHLPIQPVSPAQQQERMGQIYQLMAKQVKSYHKHHYRGESTSVSVELAQELMESIEYTIHLAGSAFVHTALEETLHLGQELLESKLAQAKSLLALVDATAPQWQTECRWEALRYLRHYLDHYDHLHLAHRGPDGLFYPILIAPPEGIQGIDSCLFYLHILWIENQIMSSIPNDTLTPFWDRLPSATLNQCEPLLINSLGKALLDSGLDPLTFSPEEYMRLISILTRSTQEDLRSAAEHLCQWLDLKDEHARSYVQAVIPQLTMWIGGKECHSDPVSLFI